MLTCGCWPDLASATAISLWLGLMAIAVMWRTSLHASDTRTLRGFELHVQTRWPKLVTSALYARGSTAAMWAQVLAQHTS